MIRVVFGLVRLAMLVLIAAVVAFGVVLVTPAASMPDRVDAVIVLAGGQGERLVEGKRIVRSRRAGTLAISHGYGSPEGRRLCRDRTIEGIPVVCFDPSPDTTKGEAIAVRRLATIRRWRSVALVTSTYHVRRAVWLTRRCVPALRVSASPAPPPWSRPATWASVLREEGALLKALALDRSC